MRLEFAGPAFLVGSKAMATFNQSETMKAVYRLGYAHVLTGMAYGIMGFIAL